MPVVDVSSMRSGSSSISERDMRPEKLRSLCGFTSTSMEYPRRISLSSGIIDRSFLRGSIKTGIRAGSSSVARRPFDEESEAILAVDEVESNEDIEEDLVKIRELKPLVIRLITLDAMVVSGVGGSFTEVLGVRC